MDSTIFDSRVSVPSEVFVSVENTVSPVEVMVSVVSEKGAADSCPDEPQPLINKEAVMDKQIPKQQIFLVLKCMNRTSICDICRNNLAQSYDKRTISYFCSFSQEIKSKLYR